VSLKPFVVFPSVRTYCGLFRNPAPVDRWFIPLFIWFQYVSTIDGAGFLSTVLRHILRSALGAALTSMASSAGGALDLTVDQNECLPRLFAD
jgi:hypothetical protein